MGLLCLYYPFTVNNILFYQFEYEEKASSVAHFSFMYLNPLPDDGPMNDQIMSEKNNNKPTYSVLVLRSCAADC
jgi:hypothetical protein